MKKTAPLFILPWRSTFSCDSNCLHCTSARKSVVENELSTKEAMELVDKIKDFGSSWVGITGGEALLRKDIFEIIAYINKVGLKASLITDGHLLDKEKYKQIIRNDVRISISIDGAKETNDKIRGKGSYIKALEAIEEFSNNNLLNCLVYTFVKINNYESNLTVEDFRHVLDLAKEYRARWVIYHGFIPYSNKKDQLLVDPNPNEYEWAFNKLYDLNLIYKGKPEINVYCPFYARIAKQRGMKDFDNWFNNFFLGRCFFGKFMSIAENGDAIPCSYNDFYRFGNIKEKSIKEIWEDLRNSSFFAKARDKKNLRGKCGVCEYKNICGGCRTEAEFYKGDILGSDPRCAYIPRVLRKE